MMNRLASFFDKQYGTSNDLTYDFALSRLCVPKKDSWKGITPSVIGSDYNPEPPIFAAKFANCANYKHILAIANEDGKIALQNANTSNPDPEEKALEGQQCHYNAVFDVEWAPGQMKFVSASGDHTARLWDITESKMELSRVFNGHSRSVKTAAFRKTDSAVFATGGRDGAILIWDTRASLNVDLTPRADNCIYSGHAGGPGTPVSHRKKTKTPKCGTTFTSSSITGLVFQDDMTLVSCGSGDGVIKVWDLRRNYTSYKKEPLPKYSLPYAGTSTLKGFTNLLVDEGGVKLYANCMDNTIYCYNLSSYSTEPMERYVGYRNSTFYIKSCLSPDGKYLISGSSDEKAYIWNVKNPQPLVALQGHTVEVTCVAWSGAGNMPIVTCSDDAQHKIWRIGPEKIEINDKINYSGHAEYCKEYTNFVKKNPLKLLEYTPRSLRRIVEKNERTPNTIEKISLKRSFSEISRGEQGPSSDHKRPHLENRGRRLFSPSTSSVSMHQMMERETKMLAPVFEETDNQISSVVNHPEDSNQENSLKDQQTCIIPCNPSSSIKSASPLTERMGFNLNLASSMSITQKPSTSTSILFSPTSNLPNYVVDGEAPHLHLMSPKRKFRDKVDWLTKIRKQKLLSSRACIGDKLSTAQSLSNDSSLNQEACLSPRLQSLKNSESTPKSPKRRISHSGPQTDEATPPKVPTPNRRNSETSILKFFTIATQSQTSGSRQGSEIPTSNLSATTASCRK